MEVKRSLLKVTVVIVVTLLLYLLMLIIVLVVLTLLVGLIVEQQVQMDKEHGLLLPMLQIHYITIAKIILVWVGPSPLKI